MADAAAKGVAATPNGVTAAANISAAKAANPCPMAIKVIETVSSTPLRAINPL